MAKIVRSKAIPLLEIFAWLTAFGGIIYAPILIFTLPRPHGLIIGIAVLTQGIFLCAFFLVIAAIADNVTTIAEDIQNIRYKGATQEEIEHFLIDTTQKFRNKEEYEKWRQSRMNK